jgi:serine/threonine protein kinase
VNDIGAAILTKDVSTLYFPASISMEARDFIQSCLVRSPARRPQANDLLDHDWFLVQAEFEMESHHNVIFPQVRLLSF